MPRGTAPWAQVSADVAALAAGCGEGPPRRSDAARVGRGVVVAGDRHDEGGVSPKSAVSTASLPAATTGTAPRSHAYRTASPNPSPNTRLVVEPRDRLITSAPWSAAQRMAAATSGALPATGHPSQGRSTLIGMIRAAGCHASDPDPVPGGGRRDAGDVRAVAVVVLGRSGAGIGVAPVSRHAVPGTSLVAQVLGE